MADAAAIERLITEFIREELMGSRDAAVDPEDNLFTAGYVDSVGIMRLIAHLEATLKMKVPPTDLIPQNFRTVRVMAAYLARNGASPDS
jgi:acyl carrier protein